MMAQKKKTPNGSRKTQKNYKLHQRQTSGALQDARKSARGTGVGGSKIYKIFLKEVVWGTQV